MSKLTAQTCCTSALPESVQTACSTCGFRSRCNNQAECLSKLDYLLNLTSYLYGQVMITLTVNMLLVQKMPGPWERLWAAMAQSSLPPAPRPWSPCQSAWGPQSCPRDTIRYWSPDPPPPGPAQPWALHDPQADVLGPSLAPQPCPAIPRLSLTPVPFPRPDPADVPAWPQPCGAPQPLGGASPQGVLAGWVWV